MPVSASTHPKMSNESISSSVFKVIAAIATEHALAPLSTALQPPTVTAMSALHPTMPSPTLSLPSSPSPSSTSSNSDQNTGECQLLGPFAILVQGALGLLALLSLVYKRWRERPQRPLKIWAFDASKQVFGSVLLHLANLVMSMFSAGQIQAALASAAASAAGAKIEKYQPNPCSFYLLNLAIDTTLGIPILIIILRVLTAGASLTAIANPPESIKSGNYGSPPRATWWLKQSLIYFLGLLGMKTCVFFIFELLPWIARIGDWALRWTEGNEAVQIAFVMLIFPLIMNAMQYYIIDSFIKGKAPEQEEESAGEHGALLANDTLDEPAKDDEDNTSVGSTAGLAKLSSSFEDERPHQPEASGSGSSAIREDRLKQST